MLEEKVHGSESMVVGANFDRLPVWDMDLSVDQFTNWYTGPSPGAPQDHFGHVIIGQLEHISPPINWGDALNLVTSENTGEMHYVGYKPIMSDRGVSNRVSANAALLHNAMSLFTGKADTPGAFISPGSGPVGSERPVTHTNLFGSVGRLLPDWTWHRRPYDSGFTYTWSEMWPLPYHKFKLSRSPQGTLLMTLQVGRATFTSGYARTARGPIGYARHNIADQVDFFEGYEDAGFGPGGNGNRYSNISYQLDGDSLSSISYDFERWEYPIGYTWFHCKWHVEFEFEWVIIKGSASIGETIEVGTYVKLKCTYRASCSLRERYEILVDEWIDDSIPSPIEYTHYRPAYATNYQPAFWGYTDIVGASQLLSYNPSIQDFGSDYDLLRTFDREIAYQGYRLFPGAVLAANDALDKAVVQLEANHVENLAQLDGIRGLIGPYRNFVKLAGHVKRKDAVGTIISLVDLLSDAQLLYSYAIAPTVSDAEEIASEASQVVRHYRDKSLYDWKIYYGSFNFDVPNSFSPHFQDLRVKYRSKIRIRLNPNSVLASILPIKAFGLLPTLSNMWDLIPFSFVADWFTGIGSKLEAVDSAITFMAFDIQYVEMSMKVYWDVDTDLVSQCSLQSFEAPYLTYYCRSVLKSIPGFAYSDLDFKPGPGLPDWKTVSSLLWKIVRR
jgi:hypothetical protein